MDKMRKSNIELLRIVAAMGVVILHLNGYVGKWMNKVNCYSFDGIIIIILEVIFSAAVPIFVMIFGYFSNSTELRSLKKPMFLIFLVIMYRILTYLVQIICRMESYSTIYMVSRILPINYYIILYCTLYVVSPFINRMLYSLSNSEYKIFASIIIVLFSVIPFSIDIIENYVGFGLAGLSPIGIDGSQAGYTIVNFFLFYCLGKMLSIFKIYESKVKKLGGGRSYAGVFYFSGDFMIILMEMRVLLYIMIIRF